MIIILSYNIFAMFIILFIINDCCEQSSIVLFVFDGRNL
jgi:hypothetical protein